jgi:hypothetical protein
VEELGNEAAGPKNELLVIDIPENSAWRISQRKNSLAIELIGRSRPIVLMSASRKYSHSRPLGHPNREPGQKPAKPADAAILIAWRKNRSAGVEVLMGRRTNRAAFLPPSPPTS